ncbi:hypothetical protein TR13x_06785 [Caloranaerobacter sp. TR13]|uniref:amidohydrolase family protein n=1 Tax=Caloranaerobacter sp. TR13 TaxID=1302151 RepID=UPI0006D462F6|nr:amidohydrolase family protein [Caloranaerobacter sp. TR13]KPU27094.1 hypothetical protein TR13x_06785 [Caloranaerobacter sp. TR13]
MEIIDAHVHSLACGIMCGGQVDTSYKTVREGLKNRGIDKAVFVPINDISWQPVDEMNDYMISIIKNDKDIVGFIDIDISKMHYAGGIKKIETKIIELYERGLKGIKIHLQNLGVNGDDWRLLAIYRLAGEINIPVMIHCYPGSSPGLIENSHPKYIEKIVRVFHKTSFIIAHFGGVPYFNLMPWLNYDNVYFETSGVLPILKKNIGIEKVKLIFEEIGYDKIFFGSDFPTKDIDIQIDIMREVVNKENLKYVFSENIKKFGRQFNWWKK